MHPVNEVVAHPDVHAGAVPPEPVEAGRQLVQADAVAGGQFNDAGGGVPDFRHPPLHLVVEPEHFQKMPVENFPRRRQLEEAAMPLRQPRAEFTFQGPEQVAGVGLGAVVPFRRAGEVFDPDNIAEHPQGSHLHDATGLHEGYFFVNLMTQPAVRIEPPASTF
jgi:hypothetical protein